MSDQESNETPAETQAPAVAAVAEPGEVATAPVGGTERALRKSRVGVVVSDKMEKTIVVELESRVQHPKYGKIIRTTTKVKAHDEDGIAGIGDRVSLMETRPLSATKRWRLVEILEQAK